MPRNVVQNESPEDDPPASAVRKAMLQWFDARRRDLPWRAPKGQLADPYAVWVSEVMCQQTRVDVVRGYYQRWMAALPDVESLANSQEDDVLQLWQGLGYYSRARRLRQGAQFILNDRGGRFPESAEDLEAVPGIGPYSAGAISSIAFGRPSPAVDGNVIRVLTRLHAWDGDPAKAPLKKRIWSEAQRLIAPRRPGDFNQSLMELGAMVCSPRKPSCYECPVSPHCRAHAGKDPENYPQIPKKAPPTELQVNLLVVEKNGRFLLEPLASDARWWAGMWTFPFAVEQPGEKNAPGALRTELGLGALSAEPLEPLKHTITRFRLTIRPWRVKVGAKQAISGSERPLARWKTPRELEKLALPAPHRKLLNRLKSAD